MPSTLISSTATALRAWLRARAPTRESIVSVGAMALVFAASYLAAFFVRSELLLLNSDSTIIVRTIGWVVLVKVFLFYARGICHRPLRAMRFDDLSVLVRAVTTALLLFVAVNYYASIIFPGWVQIPRTVIVLDWAFTLLAVGGLQAVARSIYEEIMPANPVGYNRRALVIDASPEGQEIATALTKRMDHRGFFVSGILDDDPDRYGLRLAGTRVIGMIGDAVACAGRLRASDVVIRRGTLCGSRLRELSEACERMGVTVSIAEIRRGSRSPAADGTEVVVRGLEIEDLISHPEASLESHHGPMRGWIGGETVLVTGAGGSIGSEICGQLIGLGPARLVLVERSEYALFEVESRLRELRRASGDGDAPVIEAVLGDVADGKRMEELLGAVRPSIVIHAAAFKHVPILESHPAEAIENNTLATARLAEIAESAGVRSFVSLSTDKVVNPTSVMGASKLLAERFLQALADSSPSCSFVSVRFGNVLGSSGSVLPIFERQLAEGAPIKVTHPDVCRYFMTLEEAAGLVLLSGAVADRGGTFVLDMGEPLPIVELVRSLAHVTRVPREAVRIEFCGLRPGEKLVEELFFADETRERVEAAPVFRVRRPARPLEAVRAWLEELRVSIDEEQPRQVRDRLLDIVARDCAVGAAELDGTGDTGREGAA